MANVLDSDVETKEFELQSRYYVHLWANSIKKGRNPLISPAIGQKSHLYSPKRTASALNIPQSESEESHTFSK